MHGFLPVSEDLSNAWNKLTTPFTAYTLDYYKFIHVHPGSTLIEMGFVVCIYNM
jgi:hypothetical protein